MTTVTPREHLTTSDLEARWLINRHSIRRMVRQGRLPARSSEAEFVSPSIKLSISSAATRGLEGTAVRDELQPDAASGWFANLPQALHARLRALPPADLNRLISRPQPGRSQPELFRDACILNRGGFSPEEQHEVINARFAEYYRTLEDREFRNAVAAASRSGDRVGPKWPAPNDHFIRWVTHNCAGAGSWLVRHSPTVEPWKLTPSEVLDCFFNESDLVCFADADRRAETNDWGWFRGHEADEGYEYVVPNPMSAITGVTKTGRVGSLRCEANAAKEWRHIVVEFDRGTEDQQVASHAYLARYARLLMVVFSGGKSFHGWFDAPKRPSAVIEFQRLASALGADTKMFKTEQLARVPNAWRAGKQAHQAVRYLAE